MDFFQNYIRDCIRNYSPCETGKCVDENCNCHCREKKSCTDCLSDMFNNEEHANRLYKCTPITFSYAIRYTNRYASEIYIVLRCKLVNNSFQNTNKLNVSSIGCGPATELVALEKFSREQNKQVNYYGYDLNDIWKSVQQTLQNNLTNTNCIATFFNSDFQDNNKILPEIDILILNYVISDIYKHNKEKVKKFLENIIKIVKKMKKNSIIIINDVNSYNMGRDEIEDCLNDLNKNYYTVAGAYFDYSGRYRNQKFSKLVNIKEFPITPLLFDTSSIGGMDRFIDHISECRSAFIMIKKIGGSS